MKRRKKPKYDTTMGNELIRPELTHHGDQETLHDNDDSDDDTSQPSSKLSSQEVGLSSRSYSAGSDNSDDYKLSPTSAAKNLLLLHKQEEKFCSDIIPSSSTAAAASTSSSTTLFESTKNKECCDSPASSTVPAYTGTAASTSTSITKRKNFPQKLHMILSNPQYRGIITWLPHGRAWKIIKPTDFEDHVLPTCFRHGSYKKFIRQLNEWGFQRISTLDEYYHEMFLRGLPELCQKIKRVSKEDRERIKKQQQEGQYDIIVPDFDKLSHENPLPSIYTEPNTSETAAAAATISSAYASTSMSQAPGIVAKTSSATSDTGSGTSRQEKELHEPAQKVSVTLCTSASPKKTGGSGQTTFPNKLYMILSNPDLESIISWLHHGRAWKVVNPKAFEEKVLPQYFRHKNYKSFIRQLYLWGFRRITFKQYYHEMFLRGFPQLCENMKLLSKEEREKRKKESSAAFVEFNKLIREHPLPEVTASSHQYSTASGGSAITGVDIQIPTSSTSDAPEDQAKPEVIGSLSQIKPP